MFLSILTSLSLRMSGVVLLELLSESGENCVYFKEDGGRFTQTQTLKLAVNTAYLIRVSW